jgi:protoporphyrin/coproporphyrin ferrochelatase
MIADRSPSPPNDHMPTAPTGIVLLAYGSPDTPDDVEPYFRHIRGGRAPSSEAVADLRRRYELIGGQTPLRSITTETAGALQATLDARAPGEYRTYVAMKHWHPFIGDVIPRMAADGVRRVVAIVLAPHYSRMSVGSYRQYVEEAIAKLDAPMDLTFIESWHLEPAFLTLMAGCVREGLTTFPEGATDETCVVFSAHSLPVRIRTWDDPYEAQLLASAEAVAREIGLRNWRFAWQSAGHTGEPWLGPDIVDYLETLHAEGVRNVLSVPIGFVCDHLEVLYDIDHEAADKASALGMTLRRTRMPNATPELIAVLDRLVARVDRAAPTQSAAALV